MTMSPPEDEARMDGQPCCPQPEDEGREEAANWEEPWIDIGGEG